MCGIFVYLQRKGFAPSVSNGNLFDSFMKFQHRGPDKSTFITLTDYGLSIGFHRLAIMDRSVKGDQPFTHEDEENITYIVCNGEIYNYVDLCEKYDITLSSSSDCEVILHLYKKYGIDYTIKVLENEFSFAICEINKNTGIVTVYVGRDQAGTRMLYITGNNDEVIITSEAKGSPFLFRDYVIQQFPPRYYQTITNVDEKIFDLNSENLINWLDFKKIEKKITTIEEATVSIRNCLTETVKKMTMGERQLCCLLSGGLDSSLIAALLAKVCKEMNITLYTYSIGLTSGSSDRPFAEKVAKHIGSIHYHIEVTEEYALKTLSDIPGKIETIDVTTSRASTFQYLILDWISKNTDFKIIFCGDGSDELFTSYKYFHNAPNSEELHNEGIRLVEDIHMYDGLRAGMCATACGLEIRFVFLAKQLLELVFSIDPELRMPKNGIEKWILRESFKNTDLLPDEILWRSKEAMSDACSTGARLWYEIIKDEIEKYYTDSEYEFLKKTYENSHMPIISKEALYYRQMFEKVLGTSPNTQKITPYYWLPKWCGDVSEPSATVLDVYKNTQNIQSIETNDKEIS